MKEHQRFRLFFAWDFAREERWINRMARDRGWMLKRVGFCRYVFEEDTPGTWYYRLELQRRSVQDAAEKQYLRAIHASEVCRNGDWSYYRRAAADGPFASYACCDSKLRYLRPLYRRYLVLGAAVYAALAMDLSAFLSRPMTRLHAVVLGVVLLVSLGYTVGLTRFHFTLKHLRHGAAEEAQPCRKEPGEDAPRGKDR